MSDEELACGDHTNEENDVAARFVNRELSANVTVAREQCGGVACDCAAMMCQLSMRAALSPSVRLCNRLNRCCWRTARRCANRCRCTYWIDSIDADDADGSVACCCLLMNGAENAIWINRRKRKQKKKTNNGNKEMLIDRQTSIADSRRVWRESTSFVVNITVDDDGTSD